MKKDTELLFSITEKGCKFDYYKGSGKGGQKRNKTENCVRCRHIPSGAMATSEEGRSKDLNKRRAFKKMSETKEFKIWMKREVSIISGELDKIKNYVKDEISSEKNIKIEVFKDGKWQLVQKIENED